MSATAAVLTAAALGVTHAVEPDHVAGISALTSRHGSPRRAALVGACFSLGHVAFVVAWLALLGTLLDRPALGPELDALGTLGAGVLLGVLGVATVAAGLRSFGHDRGDGADGHSHVHVPGRFHVHAPGCLHAHLPGRFARDHAHTTGAYLRTGVVGALFTLSPPLSMLAFTSAVLPTAGVGVAWVAVAVYAAGITLTMSVLGAGVGALFRATDHRSGRAYAASRVLAGVAVTALATAMLVGVAAGAG